MCWDQRSAPQSSVKTSVGNSDVVGCEGLRAAEVKGISVMKLSSSRRSLRRPYTVLTGEKELELKAGSSKATHMVFPASLPTPEFFHFPGGGGILNFPFLISKLLHPCCLHDQSRSLLLCLSWCEILSSFWKQTPRCDIKAVPEAFLGCPSGVTLL